jgi:hypothetical protein
MTPPFDAHVQKQKLALALERFVERLAADKHILAAVQVGSFADPVLWRKETIGLWIIEEDGVSRRLKSDGNEERIFRTFVEEDVNIHAEIIPRSRFKLMVEGSSRTAFSCNFFAERKIVHCTDPSISSWFEKANALATKDQKRELLSAASWVLYSVRHARKILDRRPDVKELHQTVMWAAHGLAAIEVIARGEVCEGELLERAVELNPALFRSIYVEILEAVPALGRLQAAVERIETLLDTKFDDYLEPLLAHLQKQNRVVPLSEIADHFAHSQLYPWHLEAACEWLARNGKIAKLSAPFRITKKSRVEIEEPAYLLES